MAKLLLRYELTWATVLVGVVQRNKNNRMWIVYIEIYIKESEHMIMQSDKSKICSLGWWAGNREDPKLQFKSESCLLAETLFVGRVVSLCSVENYYLDGTQPHCKGQSTLFKVHWFKCSSHPKKKFFLIKKQTKKHLTQTYPG